MKYLFSVDAGGSKTIAVLTTVDLEPVVTVSTGSMNILENGERVVRRNLRNLRKALQRIPGDSEIHTCFGMPALGEFEDSEKRLSRIISEEVGVKPDILVNDVVVGWAAGTLGNDGIHVVAGTGTIAYGRHWTQECRSGGWGSFIGDEGSAYDIGRETLRRICRQIDGREPQTLLKDFVMKKLGLRKWWELSNWVYSRAPSERRPIVAGVARLTYEAARLGDEIAIEILKSAGREIALCVAAVVHKLGLENPLISYSGSVLIKNCFVKEEFTKTLEEMVRNPLIREATLHPAIGGLVLLLKKTGVLKEAKQLSIERLKLVSDLPNE